jgi:threonylcarbamoyladenosine tRNA methylthiotransferase MtaB
MVTVAIKTTGCKVNQADSAKVVEALLDLQVRFVELGEEAHIAVVNACTVTACADRDARQAVYRALRTVKGSVFLTGCFAERISLDGGFGERVRIIRGTWDREELVKVLRQEVIALEAISGGERERQIMIGARKPRGLERVRPIIKVQDGCDRECSYCIVPKVRGRGRSCPINVVLEKVEIAKESGASEIVIAGTDLGSWGRDFGGGACLVDLLEACLKHAGGMRIRLSSLEPEGISEELVQLLMSCEDLCPHLHVSLQSGSLAVLKAMNRNGQFVSRVVDAVSKLRAKRFGFAIGMDIICGFPTERESDFLETFELLRAIDPTYLHVFRFSRRPGTKALLLKPVCSDEEVRERCRRFREFALKQRERWAREFVGKDVEIVDIRCLEGRRVEGLTGEYYRCVREGTTKRTGRFRMVVQGAEGRILRVRAMEA